jgi:hypothetical protein
MPQGDLNVANQSGAAFRSDLNNQLLALGTMQSGVAAPDPSYAYQLWADTANGLLKQRNGANNAWLTIGTLDATNWGLLTSATAASTYLTQSAAASGYVALSGNQTIAGTKTFSSVIQGTIGATLSGTNAADLVLATMADNDQFRIRVGGFGGDQGWAEIATSDNGNEPIYVRQYSGNPFANLIREAALLDGSGNTYFPNSLGLRGAPVDSEGWGTALDLRGTAGSAIYIRSTNNGTYGVLGYWGPANNSLDLYNSWGSVALGAPNNRFAVYSEGVFGARGPGYTERPAYFCRAWVNFDGLPTIPSVRASGNVSSVARLSTGSFRVSFTTSMPDANYIIFGGADVNRNSARIDALNSAFFDYTTTTGGSSTSEVNAFYSTVGVIR